MVSKQIACIALVGLVAACGARASNPVAISQPGDKSLTCEQIEAQVKANNDLAVKKAGGDQATLDQNAAAVAVGTILFWPAMLHGAGFRTPSAVYCHGFVTVDGQVFLSNPTAGLMKGSLVP